MQQKQKDVDPLYEALSSEGIVIDVQFDDVQVPIF